MTLFYNDSFVFKTFCFFQRVRLYLADGFSEKETLIQFMFQTTTHVASNLGVVSKSLENKDIAQVHCLPWFPFVRKCLLHLCLYEEEMIAQIDNQLIAQLCLCCTASFFFFFLLLGSIRFSVNKEFIRRESLW